MNSLLNNYNSWESVGRLAHVRSRIAGISLYGDDEVAYARDLDRHGVYLYLDKHRPMNYIHGEKAER